MDGKNQKPTSQYQITGEFPSGRGELKFSSPLAGDLAAAARKWLADVPRTGGSLSRSDGDLRRHLQSTGEVRRSSSWYSGPSEVSLDDIDLVMSKESKRIPAGQLSHSARARALGADESMSDRRSLLSIASGIYEEILDVPRPPAPPTPAVTPAVTPAATPAATTVETPAVTPDLDTQYCPMSRPIGIGLGLEWLVSEEPAYESVSECVYASARRVRRPPPLPPRSKLGESWSSRVSSPPAPSPSPSPSACPCPSPGRHGSLGSLPRCCSVSSDSTLPKRQPFSVFRKRLKSDSRLISSPKSETSKENKGVEPKKKRFEFTPTRDIFKSFKVGRRMKNLKISGGLTKGETKSCEFLDESEHVAPNRCSKSVECLEDEEELDAEEALPPSLLPHELLRLLLRPAPEEDYLPMCPALAPPDHYMVMSPRNIAGV